MFGQGFEVVTLLVLVLLTVLLLEKQITKHDVGLCLN